MKNLFVPLLGISLLLSGCSTSPLGVPPAGIIPSEEFPIVWVEAGPHSEFHVRAISDQPHCPILSVDSKPQVMKLRAASSRFFPRISCEWAIPKKAKTVAFNGRALPRVPKSPKKILILGDTGCRIKVVPGVEAIQDCRSSKDWPFEEVASRAAEWKPDLVIHVGDYHYRNSPCPPHREECRGMPYGDNWAAWEADFFAPARALLKAAPWVFVRGNHETCHAAGEGWDRYLNPYPYSPLCVDESAPYRIDLGATQWVVMDTVETSDETPSAEVQSHFESEFKAIQKFPIKSGWILSHKPMWAMIANRSRPEMGTVGKSQANLFPAWQKAPSSKIDFFISGHAHTFEALTFKDKGPSQLVVGNGGTALDIVLPPANLKKIGDRTVDLALISNGFGFLTLEAQSKSWKAEIHDQTGKVLRNCRLKGKQFTCDAKPSGAGVGY